MLAAATLLIPGIVRTGDSLSRESSISSSIWFKFAYLTAQLVQLIEGYV